MTQNVSGKFFFDLIGNAVKFTSEGSVVTLESRIGPDGRLDLAGSVSDSGIGINEEEVRTIFEAFAQSHAAIHRKYGGSGLGLAICQNLLEAMGGAISVNSTPGVGSTFAFTLLVRALTAEDALPNRTALTHEALEPCLRILVVDDVPNNVRLTIAILRRLGYAAEAASDGHEAIRLATASAYDIIFMDVLMPECDGLEATRGIRRAEASDPHRKPARIIALTADAFAENRTRCLAAGMDDFVTKPLRIDALRQALLRIGGRPVYGT